MARGFLSGLIVGGVVSASAAAVVSVLAPPVAPPQVSDAAPGVSVPDRVTTAGSGETGSTTDRSVQTGSNGSQTQAPQPGSLAAIDDATLDTAGQPQTGAADDLAPPAAGSDASGVALGADDPVLPNPQALAPMAPQEADDLSISTEPAQPPAPQAETDSAAFDAPATENDAVTLPASEDPGPQTAASEAPPAAPQTAEAPQADTQDPVAPDAPAPEPAPEPTPAPEPEPGAETETETAALAPAPAGPAIGTPGVSLIDRAGSVSVRRPNTDSGTPASDATAANSAAEPGNSVRAIEAFAASFTPEDDKPLMSIVLIDEGNTPVSGQAGLAALSSFPYPLSFAVDTNLPDAADRMALYRAEGFEVLAMVDLPPGAQPTDVETTFGAVLTPGREVVGILGAPSASLQDNRAVSDQVAEILSQGGYGWVTQPKGLNTAATLARRAGVPARAVFRDFDSSGQTAVVIRRFLDQAAFKAGQESGVIMLGRMRPETISALLLWGLQDRAGQVALAPISATLLQDQ